MNKIRIFIILPLVLLMAACATTNKKIEQENAPVTVNKFVESHGAIMNELAQSKGKQFQLSGTAQKTLDVAQQNLAILEGMSHRHGAGEITLFFSTGGLAIQGNERERLIQFADYLSRESNGRKILFVSIGSTSTIGSYNANMKLAQRRSEAPIEVLDKYLINIPHEFHMVYGTGEMYSPKNAHRQEHKRYQNVRIIAVFDTSQIPQNINQRGQ